MNYDGGKNGAGVYQEIINQAPPCDVFIECFFGSGAITRRMRPAPIANIGIEPDPITRAAVQPYLTAGDTLLDGDALTLVPLLAGHYKASGADVLIYADPPYLRETRSWQGHLYRCEFDTIAEHTRLLRMLNALPCNVMVSHYWHRLYLEQLDSPKWRAFSFTSQCRSGPRTEWVWCNFRDPVALHDYRYLGNDRTERQRIKRKAQRWARMLQEMPTLERKAILSQLQELQTRATTRDPVAACDCAGLGTEQTRVTALDELDFAGKGTPAAVNRAQREAATASVAH